MKKIYLFLLTLCGGVSLAQAQSTPSKIIHVLNSETNQYEEVEVNPHLSFLPGQAPAQTELETNSSLGIVFNEEDWHQVDGTQYPYSAIVYIQGCTGSMIGEYTVLTAAHCVQHALRHPHEMTVYSGGYKTRLHARAHRIYVLPATFTLEWGWEFAKNDMAIIVLQKPLGKKSGFLGISTTPFEPREQINAFGFPIGHDNSRPWLSSGEIIRQEDNFVFHNANVLRGNSGGPVFAEQDPFTLRAISIFENPEESNNGALAPMDQALFSFIEKYRDEKPGKQPKSMR